MSQTESLSGVVERIIFNRSDTNFYVFTVQINQNQVVTASGSIIPINVGEQIQLAGTWTMHPKFGKQFQVHSCTVQIPTSVIGLKKYLGSGLIKGIGPAYAEKLVQCFGDKVLEVIDKEPERLRQVPGIGQKRVETIIHAWKDQKEIAAIMVFLREKDISATYAAKIYKKYGKESIAVLIENPYRLSQDIWGIGFKIADQIAQNLGIARNSVKRVKAALLHIIHQDVGNGNLYIELEVLKGKTVELLALDDGSDVGQIIKHALYDLHASDDIKLITDDNRHFITSPKNYFCEKGSALAIHKLQKYPSGVSVDYDAMYKELSCVRDNELALNEDQQKGIMASLMNKVSIITGGPGTGKTTLIKKLLSLLDLSNIRYRLAAPTGRAAKRMSQSTYKNAMTIHRLLEFDVGTFRFTKDEKNALDLDFLIIDEASMIDSAMAYSILKAVPLPAHIIFIGDIDQLPSVGAGNFLHDLIDSGVVHYTRLTTIFRQAQNSMIVVNAHRVNQGEFPVVSVPEGSLRDFIFIKEDNPETIAAHLHDLFTKKLKQRGFSASDITVLVPMNRGAVGTQSLNNQLQHILNPIVTGKKYVMRHGTQFREGDRVIQLRNNYDKLVFNGDMGIIDAVNTDDQKLTITFDGRLLEYEFSELDELTLSYAITIHKSQGSEYPVIIVPLFMEHFILLQRNLVYTAITRAKKLCIFIGQTKAIAMAIKNNKSADRLTFLKKFLTSDLQAR